MPTPSWPLFDLHLRVGDLELRPMTEADLATVAHHLPADVELDPAAPRIPWGDEGLERATVIFQNYWKAYGTWTPAHWRLGFVVREAGRPVGVQELEGTDFPVLRTVDTSSFLAPDARGRGLGQRMRAAVLGMAFDGLGAEAAVTSAWDDNHASLGVSRALGYRPNGEHRQARDGRAGLMVHLRMTRQDWYGRARPTVTVTGLAPCLPLFGL